MFCDKCGSRVPDDAVFCNRCGEPLVKKASNMRRTRKRGMNSFQRKMVVLSALPGLSCVILMIWIIRRYYDVEKRYDWMNSFFGRDISGSFFYSWFLLFLIYLAAHILLMLFCVQRREPRSAIMVIPLILYSASIAIVLIALLALGVLT